MPKSVLRYVLDKGQYFDPETSFTQFNNIFIPLHQANGQKTFNVIIFYLHTIHHSRHIKYILHFTYHLDDGQLAVSSGT